MVNSPYIVTGDINIFPDATLTIEAGTLVKLNASVKLWVKGQLIAEGTSSNYISFTNNSESNWNWIGFDAGSSGTIRYCKIEKADTGIIVNSAPVEISNNQITDNLTYGIAIQGVGPDYYGVGKFPPVSSNAIFGNSTGISISVSGLFEEIKVTNNIISDGDIGIEIRDSSIDLNHNSILKNSSYGIKIGARFGTDILSFDDNVVSLNGIGIQTTDNEITSLTDNNIADNYEYALENTCSGDIDASNNWWGTTDTSLIDNMIYDINDDFSLGEVDYLPILNSSNPDAGSSLPIPTTSTTSSTIETTTTTTIETTTSSTSTIESTTTSTTTLQPCPTEEIYGEYSDETELLRYFRDNVLNHTPEGQEIIRLYYQWSPVIVRVMEEDPQFKKEVEKAIDEIIEMGLE